jgi:hypothetical protein
MVPAAIVTMIDQDRPAVTDLSARSWPGPETAAFGVQHSGQAGRR